MWFGFSTQFTKTVAMKAALQADKKATQFDSNTSSSRNAGEKGGFGLGWVAKTYLFGILAVEIWNQVLHPRILGDKFPFLPLMLISIYCALGIMYSWIWQLKRIIVLS